MINTSKFTSTVLLSLVVITASAQDWVSESDEHTTVVLKAQSQFRPEGAFRLGFTEFDEPIVDLGPDIFGRAIAVDRELVQQTRERLRTEAEMAPGDRFNQRTYHDFLLQQGLLPPELLRQAVFQEFVPKQ